MFGVLLSNVSMDTLLPRPRAVKRHDEFKSNVLCVIDKTGVWGSPESSKNTTIKEAINYNDVIYAINELGKLVMGNATLIETMKNETILALRSEAASKLFLVLEDKVLLDRQGQVQTYFEGRIDNMYCGDAHSFFETPNGWYVSGSNNYGQRGKVQEVDYGTQEVVVAATQIDNLKLDEIYVGGWHNYGRLPSGKFVGWGYNADGRLGNNGSEHAFTPIPLEHDKLGIYKLACGGWHTLGWTRTGNVCNFYCTNIQDVRLGNTSRSQHWSSVRIYQNTNTSFIWSRYYQCFYWKLLFM